MFFQVNAQELDEDPTLAIEEEITLAVETAVKENVTPLLIAEKFKIPFPPKVPTRTIAEIDKELKENVAKLVDEKYPFSIVVKHRKEALNKYRVYKKGQEITLRVMPTGRAAVVSGIFKGFNRKGELMVGGNAVPKVDMTEDVMVHFDKDLAAKKIKIYVDNKLHYYHLDRKNMSEKITPILAKKSFKEAGYFPSGADYIPGADYLKKTLAAENVSYRKKMLNILTDFTYKKHGYVKKGGVWALRPQEPIEFLSKKVETTKKVEKKSSLKEKVKASKVPVRQRESLFDSSFYDPNFE